MSNKEDKNISGFIKETDVVAERIKYYSNLMKNKDIIDMKFAMADTSGNLYFYDNGIRIQLDNIDINGSIYEPRYRSSALAKTYPVIVKSIDKDEVHVSHHEAKAITKEELIAEIDEALKNEESLIMVAKVMFIKGDKGKSYCLIDIGGVGITGVIMLKDWSKAYTEDFRLVAKRGDIINVVVKRKGRWNGFPAYHCSRGEALEDNPWERIEEKLPKGTTVNVMCITKVEKNFFGKIDGIDEISAYCEYPDKERNIKIEEGTTYQGYVAAVSEEDKLLRVRIFNTLEK